MELKDKELPSVVAQDMDTSWYQLSGLVDNEFHWDYRDLNMDGIVRPGIDSHFSPSTFNDFKLISLAENPILIEKGQDMENSTPLPAITVSERPTQPTVLMRKCSFGKKIENAPVYVHIGLSEEFYYFYWKSISKKSIVNVFFPTKSISKLIQSCVRQSQF